MVVFVIPINFPIPSVVFESSESWFEQFIVILCYIIATIYRCLQNIVSVSDPRPIVGFIAFIG